MASAVIYSKADCPFCLRAKSVLVSKGISYEEVLYDNVTITKEYVAKIIGRSDSGSITFPQIFIDNEYVGGYTDLCAKYGINASR